ncbi:hypothetical protein GGR55DRAFT_685929 [Xylaria sp. FL0064]|nr:hypothetical protein GGR55DRAFT_685929 [Xylaria sp. FL0064]
MYTLLLSYDESRYRDDLFAAFEDLSQQASTQTQAKPPSAQSTSRPLSFASPLNPAARRSWSRPLSTSSHFQQAWPPAQPSPAPQARPASVATSSFVDIQSINNGDTEDDDGWGDFEVAPNVAPSPPPPQPPMVMPSSAAIKQSASTKDAAKQRTRIVRASTMDLVSNSLVTYEESPIQNSPPKEPPISKVHKKTINRDPNVLFDADDFEGEQDVEDSEDDFGEFETVSPPAQVPADVMSSTLFMPSSSTNTGTVKKASELLLDLDINEPTPQSTYTKRTSFDQVHAKTQKEEPDKPWSFPKAAQPQKSRIQTNSQTWEDDWDSFSDLPKQPVQLQAKRTTESTWDWDSVEPPKTTEPRNSATKTSAPPSNASTTNNDDMSWDWEPVDTKTEPVLETEDSGLPPINIPPPSILLSAFPQLIEQANEYLYKPVSGQPQSIKDRVLSDPKVYDFLRGYLTLAVVAARIIAGRKMRWHRDKFLSQSMSISAAGSKGMKLAGVDKTQTTREDREAADVVSNWKSQVGRLRSAVATVNSTKRRGGKQLKIPEITENMQVQTARDVPTAPKACVICGLKRNERLPKVDHEVEDSFGEWWVDHWGHVACRRFWLQHENTLRQR